MTMRREHGGGWTRRGIIGGAGAAAAATTLPRRAAADDASITGRLAAYMVAARDRALPDAALIACKHRILDTFAAMISGSRMQPGEMALKYVRGLGGTAQASVVGSNLRTTTVDAALANAMCAHADETDDFELVTKAHPGCSTVPAALAMAELHGSSGADFIRAVALGYDLCCRLLLALGPDLVRKSHRSAEGTSSTFGALGGAAALARLDETGTRYAISYAAQQVSGLWSWVKDKDHIEKAFDFAGMGARNGVTAVGMAAAGLTGVADVLDGRNNLLIALSTDPKPAAMLEGLGEHFYVTETAIKTFSVGYPIQSPLDATLTLRRQYGLTSDKIKHVLVRLPPDSMNIVDDSAMPDVDCQHLVALAIVKGAVSFVDSHDRALMRDPAILRERGKIQLVGDKTLPEQGATRGAVVEMTLDDSKTVQHFTKDPPGTPQNPLTTDQVSAKARDLIAPVLGADKTERLIARLNALETLGDMRDLRPLITT